MTNEKSTNVDFTFIADNINKALNKIKVIDSSADIETLKKQLML